MICTMYFKIKLKHEIIFILMQLSYRDLLTKKLLINSLIYDCM